MAHRILIPENLAPDGLLPVQGRADIALERFPLAISQPAFRELLAGAHGAVLGLTRISTPELAVAPHLKHAGSHSGTKKDAPPQRESVFR